MSSVYKEFGLRRPVDGDIGCEIEVEGYNLPRCKSWWRNEEDGSLKGEETREYVLAEPQNLQGLQSALEYLDGLYTKYESRVDDTVRAGVHIHINCQKLTLTQLYNFMVVYLILENVLVKWCGEYREGNLFCLRTTDAEYLLRAIKDGLADGKGRLKANYHRDDLRYASMNLKALGDYGSVEFRAMRGTRDLKLIYQWAEVLLGVREYAKQFASPIHIVEQFSLRGAPAFMQDVLGENYASFSFKEQEKYLWEGLRNAQDIAYSVDWQEFDPEMRNIAGCEFPITMNSRDINEPLEDV